MKTSYQFLVLSSQLGLSKELKAAFQRLATCRQFFSSGEPEE